MIAQTYMPGFAAKLHTTSFEGRRPVPFDNNSSTRFKDILDSASYRTDTSDSRPSNAYEMHAPQRKQSESLEAAHKFKAYREMSLNSRYEARPVSNDSTAEVKEDEHAIEPMDSGLKKAEAAVESLAQILGISSQELIKLLDLAGVMPEDLADATKAEEAAEKLAGLMGLAKEEEHTLLEVINTAANMIEKQMEMQNNKALYEAGNDEHMVSSSLFKDNRQQIRADMENIKVEVRTGKDLQELMAAFKLRLQWMTQKLHRNPQEFASDIAGTVKEVLEEAEACVMNKDVPERQQGDMGPDVHQAVREVKSEKAEVKPLQGKNDPDTGAKDEEVFDGFLLKGPAGASAEAENGDTVEASEYGKVHPASIMALRQDRAGAASDAVRPRQEVYIPKSEIISQVVEKAKVILDGEKSEMVMDLKPDSLGKLSLKIVTEHGMVTARFIAESQQVKQILEANMQILKDSLEKQGMSIQGFSVSVGHEASDGNGQSKGRSEAGKTGTAQAVYTAGNAAEIPEIPVIRQNINPYGWGASKINLTA